MRKEKLLAVASVMVFILAIMAQTQLNSVASANIEPSYEVLSVTVLSPVPSQTYNASSFPLIIQVNGLGYGINEFERVKTMDCYLDNQLKIPMSEIIFHYDSSYFDGLAWSVNATSYLSDLPRGEHRLTINGTTTWWNPNGPDNGVYRSFTNGTYFTVDIATPTPSPSPTIEPTSTPKQQTGFLGTNLPMEYAYAIVAVLVIIVVAGLSLVYLKKLRK